MTDLVDLERRLWSAADQLRANSSLTPAEYRGPVLGLIFLAFAEHRFDELRPELELNATERRPVSADDFRARGVLFVPEIARLSWLVELPEGEDLGANIDLAMDAIEATNTGLRSVLPRGYQKLEKSVLLELVRLFAPLPQMVSGDAFGLIYEYFLAEFAADEGRRGGEFFTPQPGQTCSTVGSSIGCSPTKAPVPSSALQRPEQRCATLPRSGSTACEPVCRISPRNAGLRKSL
jgi:type I restriction enzyme M protein